MKPKVVIFSNQKGGVGKTTLCRNLGYALSASGYKVLLVDLDSQGNLSKSFFEETDLQGGSYEALTGQGVGILKVTENLGLLAGDSRLSSLERQLVGELEGYRRLKELLTDPVFSSYDFIFLDAPPSLGMLTVNGLAAAESLLVPMKMSLFSMQGCNDLLETVAKVKRSFNPSLEVTGFIINEYEKHPLISRQIREEIQRSFGQRVFATVLSKSVKIEEAISLSCGVTALNGGGTEKIRWEVEQLTAEFLIRLGVKAAELKPEAKQVSHGQS